jgi:hypothetical protein
MLWDVAQDVVIQYFPSRTMSPGDPLSSTLPLHIQFIILNTLSARTVAGLSTTH